MVKSLLSFLLVLFVAGCSSSGGPIGSGPSGEVYSGQLVAAVLPVTGVGVYQGEGLRLQRQMGQAIADSGTFADVLAPASASDGHEGEVIIRASVQELPRTEDGRISLNVHAMRKTTGEVGLDRTYKGKCGRCGADAAGAALADAMKQVNRDLRKRYREPPVY
jgi:hypothetical protein